jgi:hypothetical protein
VTALLPLIVALALTPSGRMTAARTARAPTVDGRLNEPAWVQATPSSDFVQRFPMEGEPPSEATTVRVLYDATAISSASIAINSAPGVIASPVPIN